MYAVVSSPILWKEIQETIQETGEDILLKSIEEDVDINEVLTRISRIAIKYLIIDLYAISDNDRLLKALIEYKIMHDQIQIIIIAPNCLPGNLLIHKLVSLVSIHDIIAPTINDDTENIGIHEALLDHIHNPAPYKKAVRWLMDDLLPNSSANNGNNPVRERRERTVTIIKDKIVGTVIIAVVGTMNRIGTTHTAISIAKYLSSLKYTVALVEHNKSAVFQIIKESYSNTLVGENYFCLDNIYFYPHDENNTLLDILEEDFNYIVLDMGIYNSCDLSEFKRANVRVIVSGIKDWELSPLEKLLSEGDTIFKNIYYFTFADQKEFKEIKKSMDQLRCLNAPYNPNPFALNQENKDIFKDLLDYYLPQEKNRGNIINKFSKILNR